jgi:hypothetical protein
LTHRRSGVVSKTVLEVLVGIALPPAVFGVFALLAMWLGAETRPWFDERPVLDDRPNWGPIRRRLPRDDEAAALEADEPDDGPLEPVAAPAARVQPRPAAVTRAATSPSGV